MKVATFNINNINKRLDNLLARRLRHHHQARRPHLSLLIFSVYALILTCESKRATSPDRRTKE